MKMMPDSGTPSSFEEPDGSNRDLNTTVVTGGAGGLFGCSTLCVQVTVLTRDIINHFVLNQLSEVILILVRPTRIVLVEVLVRFACDGE